MILANFVSIFLIFGILNLADAKVFTVCELVTELDNLHSIPRDQIYKHLCIIGEMMHTNKSHSQFLGMYRIGSEWWCGHDEPDGGCNVLCSDLLDDDIADDVACGQMILNGFGTQNGWGESKKLNFKNLN